MASWVSLKRPRPVKDPVSKTKVDYTWGAICKVVFWPWYPHSHKQPHIWAYVHTYKVVWVTFQLWKCWEPHSGYNDRSPHLLCCSYIWYVLKINTNQTISFHMHVTILCFWSYVGTHVGLHTHCLHWPVLKIPCLPLLRQELQRCHHTHLAFMWP